MTGRDSRSGSCTQHIDYDCALQTIVGATTRCRARHPRGRIAEYMPSREIRIRNSAHTHATDSRSRPGSSGSYRSIPPPRQAGTNEGGRASPCHRSIVVGWSISKSISSRFPSRAQSLELDLSLIIRTSISTSRVRSSERSIAVLPPPRALQVRPSVESASCARNPRA